MRKLSFLLGSLMIGAGFLTSCSDDDPAAFESIKSEPVEGEQLSVVLNGNPVEGGKVTVVATSDTKADLTIENVVNGYPTLVVPVEMEYTGQNFKYSAATELPKPSVAPRADLTGSGVFDFSVSGVIAADGSTVSADIKVSLTDFGRGGIKPGDYSLATDIFDENYNLSKFTPLFLDWKVINSEDCPGSPDANNMLYVGTAVRMLGSHIISEVLNSVDLMASGNLSAKYYGGIIPTDYSGNALPPTSENIQTWLMGKFFGGAVNVYPRDWTTSPDNLVNWYADSEYIYILPDVKAIVKKSIEDGGDAETAAQVLDIISSLNTMTDEELKATVSSLGALIPEGMDVDLSSVSPALIRKMLAWFVTGVPLKYRYIDSYLQLYVDKDMVNDFMPLILSVGGPVLEDLITKMSAENPMMGLIIPLMLQVEHITDFVPIWENNTESFELGLTLQSAAEAQAMAKKNSRMNHQVPMSAEFESFLKTFLGIKEATK